MRKLIIIRIVHTPFDMGSAKDGLKREGIARIGKQRWEENMYHLLSRLRAETASFLIMETPSAVAGLSNYEHGPEHFLADGVIELGVVEAAEGIKRYIQVKKMRACRHRMEKHHIVVEEKGLCVLGPIY